MSKVDEDRMQERDDSDQNQRLRDSERDKKASEHDQDLLDEGIEESFPASDPPSVSHID